MEIHNEINLISDLFLIAGSTAEDVHLNCDVIVSTQAPPSKKLITFFTKFFNLFRVHLRLFCVYSSLIEKNVYNKNLAAGVVTNGNV